MVKKLAKISAIAHYLALSRLFFNGARYQWPLAYAAIIDPRVPGSLFLEPPAQSPGLRRDGAYSLLCRELKSS
jgi:hypothetical protein